MNTKLIALLMLAAANIVSPAFAADENNTAPGLTAAGAPLGLHGADPVAFLEIGNRIEGTAAFTAVHDGVAYYFSSEETMKTFAADPEKYMPQYGGFCAFGVAIGKKLDASNRYADLVDGKLYVFLNAVAFAKYEEDKSGTLAKAEENWPGMHHVAVEKVNGLGS